MSVERFEDLIAWQKARELTREVYAPSRQGGLARDLGLVGQIRRSSVSVMANIAEGFERGGRTEFHQFLSMAKASCAEVRSHLYVALDAGCIARNEFDRVFSIAEEVARVVGGLRSSVARQRDQQKGKASQS